jgi:CheY-like chemotaxis protein
MGNEVRTAHDGPTALGVAAEFAPNVVLLDIGMPGMDGYEVARRMKLMSQLTDTILVAQTGWGQEEDRRRSLEAGFDYHLVKPLDPAELEVLLVQLQAPGPKIKSGSA